MNKKSIISILILVSILLISCKKNNDSNIDIESESTISLYNQEYKNVDKIKSLKNLIESNGDTLAYIELEEIYFNSGHRDEFLYYSIFMANSYNYIRANETVYQILHTDFGKEKYKTNDKIANYYLLKAYELGSRNAKNNVEKRFNKNKIPTSKEYWYLIHTNQN